MNLSARAFNLKTLALASLTLLLSSGYFCNGQSSKAALDPAGPTETIQFVGYAERYYSQTGLRIHVHEVSAGSLDRVVVDVKTPDIRHIPGKGGLIEVAAQRDNATGMLTATKAEWIKPNDKKATITFVGKVLAVGESSGFWSGFVPSFQQVTYEVKQVVKGDYAKKRITVSHLVTHGSDMCVSQPKPSLNPAIFHTGACLEITAEYHPGKDTDEFSGCWLPGKITPKPQEK